MKIKRKKIPRFLVVLLIAVTAAGIILVAVTWITQLGFPAWHRAFEKEIIVIIPEGANAGNIGEILEEKGVITSARKFVFLTKITGEEKSIKAGRYILYKEMGVHEVLKKLVRGETKTLCVTIPEGLEIDEIANILEKQIKVDREEFLKLAKNKKYALKKGIIGKNFEGYLYPSTYEFNYDANEKDVIERLVEELWKIFNASLKKRAKEIDFTVHEVLTLASMIEKEAMIEKEKPIISQVYHKRLELDRALECDATIQYALPNHKSRLLYRDLKVKSPYNTYIHKGLPPGPIANPGKSSIIAALYPSDTDFLYYVAKGDGSHIFSKTAKEHNRAIRMLKNL